MYTAARPGGATYRNPPGPIDPHKGPGYAPLGHPNGRSLTTAAAVDEAVKLQYIIRRLNVRQLLKYLGDDHFIYKPSTSIRESGLRRAIKISSL